MHDERRSFQWRWSAMLLAFCAMSTVEAHYVEIKSTGSAVVGSTINFTATLYDNGKVADSSSYSFNWRDNAIPGHVAKFDSKSPYSNWSIEYAKQVTRPGYYRVTLEVDKYFVVGFKIATNHIDYEVTDSLVGDMLLIQDGIKRKTEYVSTRSPVNHTVALRRNDYEYLQRNATYVQTYWFQNCTYLGVTDGLSYEEHYAEEDQFYEIEALVVASFEKLPEPTTTTTTTTTTKTTTTTTTPKPTTTITTTTTPKPTTSTSTTSITMGTKPPARRRRNVIESAAAAAAANSTAHANAALLGLNIAAALRTQKAALNASAKAAVIKAPHRLNAAVQTTSAGAYPHPQPPYNCVNKTIIARDPMKAYGYFKRRIVTKLPISNFTSTGKNWLQHGDIVDMEIKCKGSATLEFCTLVFNAPYNATGNETCHSYYNIDVCQFQFHRFFAESKTVLFFIRNDVSEIVNQVTINIYEAKVQSPLSVVVVPITFTLVAVILVIFGVSYYIQSRNRFTVEVADFNFGETQSVDMEYKTFQQRLIDSIRDAWPQRRYSQSNSDLYVDGEGAAISGVAGGSGNGANDSGVQYRPMT